MYGRTVTIDVFVRRMQGRRHKGKDPDGTYSTTFASWGGCTSRRRLSRTLFDLPFSPCAPPSETSRHFETGTPIGFLQNSRDFTRSRVRCDSPWDSIRSLIALGEKIKSATVKIQTSLPMTGSWRFESKTTTPVIKCLKYLCYFMLIRNRLISIEDCMIEWNMFLIPGFYVEINDGWILKSKYDFMPLAKSRQCTTACLNVSKLSLFVIILKQSSVSINWTIFRFEASAKDEM